VIYLQGVYVERQFHKGYKGLRIFHENEYFLEKQFFHKDSEVAERWMRAIKEHSQYVEFKEKYDKDKVLGKGKFSTVYLCTPKEAPAGDEDHHLAMKQIEKKSLTRKEREFLRDEIQIIRSIAHPNVVAMHDAHESSEFMYIMMECVKGGELFEHIKDFDITEREALLITH
jgi:serine/threonine protein kinase